MKPVSHYPPVGIRMMPEHKAWLKAKAKQQERSMNYVIVKMIEREMEKDGNGNKQ